MPYHYHVPDTTDTQRQPAFVVFKKGKEIARGTAQDLQLLFNKRARVLRMYLLELCAGDDEDQLPNEYQVIRLREWEQEKASLVAHCDQLIAEAVSTYERPQELDEEELLFNPDDVMLLERIRRKKSPYYRWRRKHSVARWIAAEQFPPSEELVLTHGEEERTHQVTSDAQMKQVLRQYDIETSVAKAPPKPLDKWATKKTPVEIEHLEQKQRKRNRPEPKSFWI